jgi:hypothetical protein
MANDKKVEEMTPSKKVMGAEQLDKVSGGFEWPDLPIPINPFYF